VELAGVSPPCPVSVLSQLKNIFQLLRTGHMLRAVPEPDFGCYPDKGRGTSQQYAVGKYFEFLLHDAVNDLLSVINVSDPL
jgi:hypothetical protein